MQKIFARPKNSFIIHPHVEFEIMEAVRLLLCPSLLFGIVAYTSVFFFPTTFLEIAVSL